MAITLSYESVSYPLRHPFTISRYTVAIQKAVIVKISDGDFTGYGEATANPFYESSVEKIQKSIEKVKEMVERFHGYSPELLWNHLEPLLRDDYFALCAIDIAYWDFTARKEQRTLRSYWTDSNQSPITSFTIGMDTTEVMLQKILEFPWPLYKIKVASQHPIEIVKALREHTDAVFRIDANCAWTSQETIVNAKLLEALNVEFIEQPLPVVNNSEMRKVIAMSKLPIIADESCQREADVTSCVGLFNGVNIKLMKCGGITPALRMIKLARKNDLKVMLGCMTESTIGISALAQLAPLADYLDADGALLLAQDIATGVRFENGEILYSDKAGTGAELIR